MSATALLLFLYGFLPRTGLNLPVFVTLTESDNWFASVKGGGNGQRFICLARNDKENQCL